MQNWKAMTAGLMLAATLAVPGMTLAQNDDFESPVVIKRVGHHGHHGHHFFERMAQELDLTEGQKAQLKANREANKGVRKASREQRRELHKQIREALNSGADQATLDSLGAELGKLEIAKMQQMRERHQQFEAILTEEQKAKLEELKAERKERWKGKRKFLHHDDED